MLLRIAQCCLLAAMLLGSVSIAVANDLHARYWTGEIQDGKLLVQYVVDVPVMVNEEVVIPPQAPAVPGEKPQPGEKRTRIVKKTVMRAELRTHEFSPEQFPQLGIRRMSGEPLAEDAFAKVFAEPTLVVHLPPGTSVSDIYRKLFRPETLVMVDPPPREDGTSLGFYPPRPNSPMRQGLQFEQAPPPGTPRRLPNGEPAPDPSA